jgi:hypothetical protein
VPNCWYHPAEPTPSSKAGAPYADAVWPCCGSYGFRNSKYHSESCGRPSHYNSKHSDASSWGCKRGACPNAISSCLLRAAVTCAVVLTSLRVCADDVPMQASIGPPSQAPARSHGTQRPA